MGFKFMRVIVFFDLPVTTPLQRQEYSKFRKYLLKNGFSMMQESVYTRIAANANMASSIIANIRHNTPSHGLIQALKVTEKQFENMEYILGQGSQIFLNSTERLVFF